MGSDLNYCRFDPVMVSSIDIKKVSSRDKVVVDVEQLEVAQVERVVEVDGLLLQLVTLQCDG